MPQIRTALLLLCLLITGIAAGCRKDTDNPVGPGVEQSLVTTTIAGVIADEAGAGVAGITVTAHGNTTTTNEHGLFVFADVRVPRDRCYVIARSNGYFTASRAELPKAGGVTHMRLSLMSNTAQYSVDAAAGGTVHLADGGSVRIPARGVVAPDGTPYTGTVRIAARRLNPSSSAFYNFFPGDFTATRTDGSPAELYSFGVLRVELYSASGEPLQLGGGARAVLTYPAPSASAVGLPAEIPLWYFNETTGMWTEEGRAVKQGAVYVGEVAHFTDWNLDVPDARFAVLTGRVLCNQSVVPGMTVTVGQRQVVTDERGEYSCRVPVDIPIEISVSKEFNWGIGTDQPVVVGPFSDRQTAVQDITVGPCPSFLTGTVVDCDSQPSFGIVQVSGGGYYEYCLVSDGDFQLRIAADIAAKLNVSDYAFGAGESRHIAPVAAGSVFAVGPVELCSQQSAVRFADASVVFDNQQWMEHLAVSPDGRWTIVIDNKLLRVFDSETATIVAEFPSEGGTIKFSRDGTMFMVTSDQIYNFYEYVPTRVYSTSTWELIRSLGSIGIAAFSHDGTSVLSCSWPLAMVSEYSVATGEKRDEYALPEFVVDILGTRAEGREVVVLTEKQNIIRVDMQQHRIAGRFHPPTDYDIDFLEYQMLSSDGAMFIGWDETRLFYYDLAMSRSIRTVPVYGRSFPPVMAVSGDGGKYLARTNLHSLYIPTVTSVLTGEGMFLPTLEQWTALSQAAMNNDGTRVACLIQKVEDGVNMRWLRIYSLP